MKDSIELRDRGCQYCNTDPNGIPSPKYSYNDYDGMLAYVHDSKPNKNGFKSAAWWLTVNFRGEERDFYIDFCPFCGRRLTPFREGDYKTNCVGEQQLGQREMIDMNVPETAINIMVSPATADDIENEWRNEVRWKNDTERSNR